MSQPEHWIAYIRGASAGCDTLDRQQAVVEGLIPECADVTVVTDVGGSGLAMRPGLERVLELVRAGEATGVACVDTSRLTRSPEVLRTVVAELDRHGVALVTQSGPITTSADHWRRQLDACLNELLAKTMSDTARAARARRGA